ncbi:AraC family transcriptional regulator [Cupriavidus sp. USMAA2-4]|uniref:AraC family transcriptional regulator n=1 Tax=Cupriavidus sp. USMAA2-4 TaxID=876364 RepID=UPI0008A6A509|nr:AraC family transcriptional regulator [Cupriavidus sp. USMAA2-4]AOY95569.1 AraC family transcriptional regulator [Cupriavidus sp. USMAA2-4]
MRFWEFTRSPASVHLLVDFGVARGLAPAQLLAGTRLSPERLADPNQGVSAAQELRVAGNLLRLLEHPPGLGLEVGLQYHFSAYGVWGYGLISSATGADAMALALRFLPLTFAFCGIAYHEEHELGVLGFGEPALADGLRQFLLERDMAAAAVLLREIGGGDFRVRAFTLTARAPARGNSRRDLPTVFGATPTYGAARNSLLFDRAWLARPLPQANPVTVAMCEQMCGRLLEERRARLGTAALVRHYLDSAPGGQPPTLDGMAQRMHTSPRTLKRRLQEDGSSFRALLAEHRSALARQWLQEGNLSLTEIAARLGFSDLSTFSQAFKRWHGVAPSAYRGMREGA